MTILKTDCVSGLIVEIQGNEWAHQIEYTGHATSLRFWQTVRYVCLHEQFVSINQRSYTQNEAIR